jgi:CheY-like chemotaxis protein
VKQFTMSAKRRKTVGLKSPLVLIVESHDDTREMYATSLNFEGFRVAVAANGVDGMEQARQLQPDIITTGLALLGDIDGFQLCESLKSVDLTRRIPVIAVTSLNMPESVAHARTVGCALVLIKPCLPETLVSEIQRLLKRPSDESSSSIH